MTASRKPASVSSSGQGHAGVGPVRNFAEARKADAERFKLFFRAMLEQGVYLPPSPYEACFVSLAHRPADVEATLEAARSAMRRVARTR